MSPKVGNFGCLLAAGVGVRDCGLSSHSRIKISISKTTCLEASTCASGCLESSERFSITFFVVALGMKLDKATR